MHVAFLSDSIGTQLQLDRAGLIAHLTHELGLEASDEALDSLASDWFFPPRVESISLRPQKFARSRRRA